jgi:hypothetical protein
MKKLYALFVLLSVCLAFTEEAYAQLAPCSGSNIGGYVFRELTANGIKDAGEAGIQGVTVKAYSDASLVSTAMTLSDGSYALTGLSAGTTYRVEFTWSESYLFPSPVGSSSNTSVRFITAGSCNVNFGLHSPTDFCANPKVFTPCYVNGDPLLSGAAQSARWLVYANYPPGSTKGLNQYIDDGNPVGTVWGGAYQRSTKTLFTSAFIKRHSGLGTLGSSGIYQIDMGAPTPTVAPFIKLSDLGISTGVDPRASYAPAQKLPAASSLPSHDPAAFDAVGKLSFGDIDISEDDRTLWAMNLADGPNRGLIEITVGVPAKVPTVADVTVHGLPAVTCANGVFRAFALEVHQGMVYIGGVCTGENSGATASDLTASIYRHDPNGANGNFTLVYSFPLNYPRAYISNAGSVKADAEWRPWIKAWTDIVNPAPGQGPWGQTIHPQPMFSDMEIDNDGSIIVAIQDRFGHQAGNNNYSTNVNSTTVYEAAVGGDVLRIFNNNGTYVLENNAGCATCPGSPVTMGANSTPAQGPGGGEFYWQDMYSLSTDKNSGGHTEITIGSLSFLPGSGDVGMTAFDPLSDYRASGFIWLSNTTGKRTRSYEITGQDGGPGQPRVASFGKAAQLGDMEVLCDPSPIEIGNYVWKDLDQDGIQDPGEQAFASVSMNLYIESPTTPGTYILVGKTTTNASGQYLFNKTNVAIGGVSSLTGNPLTGSFTGLSPFTTYFISINNSAQFNTGTMTLDISGKNWELTTPNASGNTMDLRDSDGALSAVGGGAPFNGYPTIVANVGGSGQNDHTFDFGFHENACRVLNGLSATASTVCSDDLVSFSLTYEAGSVGTFRLLYSTTPLSATDLYISNLGTVINASVDVTPAQNFTNISNYTFPTNTSGSSITYYVYGILNLSHPSYSATCRPVVSATITVLPETPTVTVSTPSNTLCSIDNGANENVLDLDGLLSGSGAGFGTWAETSLVPSGGFNAGTGVLTATVPMEGITYTFTYTIPGVGNGDCGARTYTVFVTVESCPCITNQVILCPGETYTATAIVAGGTGPYSNFKWFKDGVEIPLETSSTLVISALGQYYYTGTDANGCSVQLYCPINVISGIASATLSTNAITVCNVDLGNRENVYDLASLIILGNTTGTWENGSPNPPPPGTLLGQNNSVFIASFGMASNTYNVNYRVPGTNGCADLVIPITITVNNCSCPQITSVITPSVVCSEDLFSVTINHTLTPDDLAIYYNSGALLPDANAVYSNATLLTDVLSEGANSTQAFGFSLAPGTYHIYAVLRSDNPELLIDPACRPMASTTITVNAPTASVDLADPNAICNVTQGANDNQFDLDALVLSGPTNGIWAVVSPGGGSIGAGNIYTAPITAGTYLLSYTITGIGGPGTGACNDQTYTISIQVKDCSCPIVQFTNVPAVVCSNGSFTFTYNHTANPGQLALYYILDNGTGLTPAQLYSPGAGGATLFGAAFTPVANTSSTVATRTLPQNTSGVNVSYLIYGVLASGNSKINNPVGCYPVAMGNVVVQPETPPATVTPSATICEANFGNQENVINLNSLITAGPTTGTWQDDDNTGQLVGSVFTATAAMATGTYNFTYVISGAAGSGVGNCNNRTYTVAITVNTCTTPCPEITASIPSNAICGNTIDITINHTANFGNLAVYVTTDGSVSLNDFYSPTPPPQLILAGTVNTTASTTSTVTATIPANMTSNNLEYFVFVALAPGNPNINDPYCRPLIEGTTLRFIQYAETPTATVTSTAEVCDVSGQNTVSLNSLITAGFTGGTWTETTVPISNGIVNNVFTYTTSMGNGPFTFEYRIQGKSPDPTGDCSDQVYTVTINVNLAKCRVSIGSTVFFDVNNNGLDDGAGDVGINGVIMELWGTGPDGIIGSGDDVQIITGADGLLGTADDGAAGPVVTSTVSGEAGTYFFGNLLPGNYYVRIPGGANFAGPLLATPFSSTNIATSGTDNNVDNDDNGNQTSGIGTAVTSSVINLFPDAETITETGPGGTQDNTYDNNGDMTVDFGFVPNMSVGSTVFNDPNNNGIQDIATNPLENGIASVGVELYFDANNNGVIDGTETTPVATTTTDASGNYYFPNLIPGNYQVGIPVPDASAQTSSAANLTADNVDGNDNGTQTGIGNPTLSDVFNLAPTAETTTEPNQGGAQDDATPAADANGNMTIDFGFVPTMSIGSMVFADVNNDGVQNTTNPLEDGIAGVTVQLFYDSDNNPVTPPVLVGTTTTDANGNYYFPNLPEGNYTVVLPTPPGSAPISSTGTTAGVDVTDNGTQTGSGNPISSDVIVLQGGTETRNESGQGGTVDDANDSNGDMTVDFGLVPNQSVGSTVFFDINNDGVQSGVNEIGIESITVQLLYDANNDGLITAAELIPVATTTTDANGNYFFGVLPSGNYQVVIPTTPQGAPLSSTTPPTTDNDLDSNDDGAQPGGIGTITASPVFNLSNNGEVLDAAEAGQGGQQDNTPENPDQNGNMTIDFGFVPALSIGSTVFYDANNNGIQDAGNPLEDGIAGVTVNLYYDADNSGTITGAELTPLLTTTTDVNGDYSFGMLSPGQYVVGIPTTPAGTNGSSTGQDGDTNTDGNDNGDVGALGIQSTIIVLTPNGEPANEPGQGGTQDNASDTNGDMTVDFGFVPNMSIGSTVFFDENKNGIDDAGNPLEVGVKDVIVNLLYDLDQNGTIETNEVIATTVTDGSGNYFFGNLIPGDYQVLIPTTPANMPSITILGPAGDNANDGTQPLGTGKYVISPIINLAPGAEATTAENGNPGDAQDDATANLDANGDMTVDFGFTNTPEIGLAKRNVKTVFQPNGAALVDFEFNLENLGDVALYNVSILDTLSKTFPGSCDVMIIRIESDQFIVNTTPPSNTPYTGVLPASSVNSMNLLLPGANTLEVGEKGAVNVQVMVSGCATGQEMFTNSATASGTAPTGNTSTDISDDGSEPDTDGDGEGNEVGENDPTPIIIQPNSVIGLAKRLVSVERQANTTTWVTFEYNIQNYGNVTIDSLSLRDSLDVHFGSTCSQTRVVRLTSDDFKVRSSFTGLTPNYETLLLKDTLQVGDKGSVLLTIELPAGCTVVAPPLENSATVRGTAPNGAPVEDQSQNGADPDPDGDGDPTNNDEPTPVPLQGFDYGDLPDVTDNGNYPTAYKWNGARHMVGVPNALFMGAKVDVEYDGAPSIEAKGDGDDEDGVTFLTPMIPGQPAKIRLSATNGFSTVATIYAFADFDGNGVLDPITFSSTPTVGAGGTINNDYTFTVPNTGLGNLANIYFRFRISTDPIANSAAGQAPNGEVEDYRVPLYKVGNLVWEDRNWNGLQDNTEKDLGINGVTVALVYAGADGVIDTDLSTLPASGGTSTDDDQIYYTTTATNEFGTKGIYYFCGLIEGKYDIVFFDPKDGTATRPNNITQSLDEDKDSDAMPLATLAGSPVRTSSHTGVFMLSGDLVKNEAGIGDQDLNKAPNNNDVPVLNPPNAIYPDNRVDQRFDAGIIFLDFGDLPNGDSLAGANYPTLLNANGPRHIVKPGFFLGTCVDAEIDGAPDEQAGAKGYGEDDGDDETDTNPLSWKQGAACTDDEDGIKFLTPLVPGYDAAIELTYALPDNFNGPDGYLNAWIDYNGNGILDAGEKLAWSKLNGAAAPIEPNTGALELEKVYMTQGNGNVIVIFKVPETATYFQGNIFSRFRLSENPRLSPDGILPAEAGYPNGRIPCGEVEDYFMKLSKVGNLVWEDRNYNGIQDAGEPPIKGVPIKLEYAGVDGVFGSANKAADLEQTYYDTTDASGRYYFCGLIGNSTYDPSGVVVTNYKLTASDPAGMTPTVDLNSGIVCNATDANGDDTTIDDKLTSEVFAITNPMGLCKDELHPVGINDQGTVGTFPDMQVDETHDFGYVGFDYGDLPVAGTNYLTLRDSVSTLFANKFGPRHAIQPKLYLGEGIDGELNGQPDADAGSKNGGDDDGQGKFKKGLTTDDESGVRLLSPMIPGELAYIKVTYTAQDTAANAGNPTATGYVNKAAYLRAFIDFNGDGDLNDASDLLTFTAVGTSQTNLATIAANNNPLMPGGVNQMQVFAFRVPLDAVYRDGTAFMRYRLSWEANVGPDNNAYHTTTSPYVNTGLAYPRGEVEDYAVPIAKVGNLAWFDHDVKGDQNENDFVDTLQLVLVWGGVDELSGKFDTVGYQSTMGYAGAVTDVLYNLSIAPHLNPVMPPASNDTPGQIVRTNAQGLYSFIGLIPGNYYLIPKKYLQPDSASFVNAWPRHRVLTIKDNPGVNDQNDSDGMPGALIRFNDGNSREPEVCITPQPKGERGKLDSLDAANMKLMSAYPVPDSLYNQTIDFGWVDEPNIEANLDIVGVNYPTSQICGNFNVIMHLCMKNPQEVPLDSLQAFLNLKNAYGDALYTATKPKVSIIDSSYVTSPAGVKVKKAMTAAIAALKVNSTYDGNANTSLLVPTQENSSFYLPGDSIICVRIEFEIDPTKTNKYPWSSQASVTARAVGFNKQTGAKRPLTDYFVKSPRFGKSIVVGDLSDEIDDPMNMVGLNYPAGGDGIAFEGMVADRGFNGTYLAPFSLPNVTGRDKYLDENDKTIQNDSCWLKTRWNSGVRDVNIRLDANCQALVTADLLVPNHVDACGFDKYPEGSYYRVIIVDKKTGITLWSSAWRTPFDATNYLGRELTYEVKSVANHCNPLWGRLNFEDKSVPVVTCPENTSRKYPDSIYTFVCTDVDSVFNVKKSWTDANYAYFTGLATATDNCGTPVLDKVSDVLTYIADCNDQANNNYNYAQIARTFYFRDEFGNVGHCTQYIYFKRPTIVLPKCKIDLPANLAVGDNDLKPIDMVNKYKLLESVPYYLNGAGKRIYMTGKDYCGFAMNYTDQSVFSTGECGRKIIRRWSIIDWCYGTGAKYPDYLIAVGDCYADTTWYNNIYSWDQIIVVGDATAPVVKVKDLDHDKYIGTGYTNAPKADPNDDNLAKGYDAGDVLEYSVGPMNCEASFLFSKADFIVEETSKWSFNIVVLERKPVFDLDRLPTGEYEMKTPLGVKVTGDGEKGYSIIGLPMLKDTARAYFIQVTVANVCYGSTTILVPIRIVDRVAPVMVCDDKLVITRDNLGNAKVAATDINEGSSDNCGPIVWMKVRRPVGDCAASFLRMPRFVDANGNGKIDAYDPNSTKPQDYIDENRNKVADELEYFRISTAGALMSPMLDSVPFFCCDPASVMVELWGQDWMGNRSFCWNNITIEDKTPPVCIAPWEVTVHCDDKNLAFIDSKTASAKVFGDVIISSGNLCLSVDTTYTVVKKLKCGAGTIERIWTITKETSKGPVSVTCKQIIRVLPLREYNICFPKDANFDCKTPIVDTLIKDELGCDLLAVNVTDKRYDASDDECYKIFRTYTVIDWCAYNDVCGDPMAQGHVYVVDRATFENYGKAATYVLVRDEDRDGDEEFYLSENLSINESKDLHLLGDTAPKNAYKSSLNATLPKCSGEYYHSFMYTQIIKVYDSERPVVTGIRDTFCTSPTACVASVTKVVTIKDNCTDQVELERHMLMIAPFQTLDAGAMIMYATPRWSTKDLGNGQFEITVSNLPEGLHDLIVVGRDECGNLSVPTRIPFVVKDCKAPAPICINGLSTELMPDGNGGGMMAVWAKDFVASPIYDCNGQGPETKDGLKLITKYSINRVGQAANANQTSLNLTCADAGKTILAELHAWDERGNHDFCVTYVEVQDNRKVCAPGSITAGEISGLITTDDLEPVLGVNVDLSGGAQMAYNTSSTGGYTFSSLTKGSDFTVTAQMDKDHLNGVSTFDLVLLQKHILGSQLITNAYRLIAADVNNSKSISTLDMIQIRKLILGIDTKFTSVPSWKFIDANYRFSAGTNPWADAFPEVVNVNDLAGKVKADFIAIKMGDVNGNASASGAIASEIRGAKDMILNTTEQSLKVGQTYEVPFRAKDLAQLQGFQFTLQVAGAAEIIGLDYGVMKAENFGLFQNEGVITTSFVRAPLAGAFAREGHPQGAPLQDDAILFTLKLKANTANNLSEVLKLSSRRTNIEAYNQHNDVMGVQLSFGNIASHDQAALYQNTPNPFADATSIGFYLPSATRAVLTVRDLKGATIYKVEGNYTKGNNQVILKQEQLRASGVMYYTLETSDFTATKKLVLMNR